MISREPVRLHVMHPCGLKHSCSESTAFNCVPLCQEIALGDKRPRLISDLASKTEKGRRNREVGKRMGVSRPDADILKCPAIVSDWTNWP